MPLTGGTRPKERFAYLATREFSRLPEKEQMRYMGKLRKLKSNSRKVFDTLDSLTEKESRIAKKKLAKHQAKIFEKYLDKFFKKSKEEQDRAIGRLLDKQAARKNKNKKAAAKINRYSDSEAFRKDYELFLEVTSSAYRNKVYEYYSRVGKRKKSRENN